MPKHRLHKRRLTLPAHSALLARQELAAWISMVRTEWRWLIVLVAGLVGVIWLTRPLPPQDVYIAVGQEGSTFDTLGRKFVPDFAEQGITLHVVNTPGSGASLAELADRDDQVNAALLVGGITARGSYPQLESLGSVEFAPLWLFYRGPEYEGIHPLSFFVEKRIALGTAGSATDLLLRRLLELNGVAVEERPNLLRMPHREASQKLIAGEIDAMLILDGYSSPVVQQMLRRSDLYIMSWALAPAFVKQLPFLDTVIIPRGALDLKTARPEHDIQMLASTATVLVDRDIHPVVAQVFLRAMSRIAAEQDQFFAKPGFFPAYVDRTVPLSPIAQRYFEHGGPWLSDTLPLWAASYVDRMWLLLVGAMAVIFPVFRLLPRYRHVRSDLVIDEAYVELHDIEKTVPKATSQQELLALLERIAAIDVDSMEEGISVDDMARLYSMKSALQLVRQQAQARLAAWPEPEPPARSSAA